MHFRYYNPKWSIWLSVDPLAEKYPSFSSYAYTLQNPVRYVDPTGMIVESPDTDYGLTKDGKIKQIGPTNNDPDRLFVLDENGNKNTEIDPLVVKDKKILSQFSKEENKTQAKDGKRVINGLVSNTKNKSDAYRLFKFGSDNSENEWGLQYFDDKSASISVSPGESSTTVMGNHSLTNKGKIVTYDVHSHNQNTPSDFKVSRTDYSRALNLHKKNPNVRVMLYMSRKENPRARMLNILTNKWVKDY